MTSSDIARLQISDHAKKRFVEKGGARGPDRAEADLLAMAVEGREIQPSGEFLERTIAEHGGEPRYVKNGGWLLVLQEGGAKSLVVVTVYAATMGKRWL